MTTDERLEDIARKLDETHESVERLRKFFMWTLIAAGVMFVLPLIGILLLIPTYLNMLSGLTAF
ncbi:hypothetical protein ACFL26_00635 [Patescibacteria group bacterium]